MAIILVIEDNPANLKLTTLLLTHAGHEVIPAVDAEAGILAARNERPDLILMDLQLPRMDGLTATTLLKENPLTARIPVVALTAMAWKGDRTKSKLAGCDGYISKPIAYQDLYDVINPLLAARTTQP